MPYWRGRLREFSAAVGGKGEEIGGINSEDEEVDAKKSRRFKKISDLIATVNSFKRVMGET